jgi:radical SAM superfamily enzyme YgiQ (UPF0313 family)
MASIALIKPFDDKMVDAALDMPQNLLEIGTFVNDTHDVTVVDLCLPDATIPSGMDYYGFSIITPTYNSAIATIKRLKAREPSSTIIVGGRHIWADEPEVDIIVNGEGHAALRQILDAQLTGKLTINGSGVMLGALDFNLTDASLYMKRSVGGHLGIGVLLNRGCNYNCYFCSCDFLSISRPMSNVEQILADLSVISKYIKIVDDNFVTHNNFEDIANLLRAKFSGWSCLIRGDIPPSKLAYLTDNGCIEVHIGVETGSDRLMQYMNKHETVAQIAAGIDAAKKHGLYVKGSVVVGFPSETDGDIECTIRFLQHCGLDKLSIHRFVPYPLGVVYNNPEMFGVTYLSDNYEDYTTTGKVANETFRTNTINIDIIQQRVKRIKDATAGMFDDA